jgi:hypothetical protein
MSLIFNEVNPNDPAEILTGQITATNGTKVADYRMDYVLEVLTDSVVTAKKAKNDTSDIKIGDFDVSAVPLGLTDVGMNSSPPVYNAYVNNFIRQLLGLKIRQSNPLLVNGIEQRLRELLSKVQGVNTPRTQVTRIVAQMLLNDEGNDTARGVAFGTIFCAPGAKASLTPAVYYDSGASAVGFNINVVKWRYSTLKSAAESLVRKESLDFDSLFNPNNTHIKSDVEFVNVNGKLVRRNKDGSVEPYDLDTMVRNSSKIQGDTCNALGLNNPADCNNFFTKCQKDSIDECNTFMDGLDKPGFLNLVKNLKHVDPLHVNWVVKKFAWPSEVKNGVRILKHTNRWLNPNNYSDKKEADLMKKIKLNTNLVAFFDAVKATTDAFPAILNPNYTGDGVANPFASQVAKSKVGKFGLKALMTQHSLSLSEYKMAFLRTHNMVSNNMTTLAASLGIRGLVPAPFLLVGGGPMVNTRVEDYVNKLNPGTGFVPSADYTRKLWSGLMENLRARYGMDVSAIDMDVTTYLDILKDYESRVHKAIAYVKVFTDNLVQDDLNGNSTHPYKLTRDVLEDLTTVRDKLVSKTFNKNNTFFKNLLELLDRLDNKLNN